VAGEASPPAGEPRDAALGADAVEASVDSAAADPVSTDGNEVPEAAATQEGTLAEAVVEETPPEAGTPDVRPGLSGEGPAREPDDQASIEPEPDAESETPDGTDEKPQSGESAD
jgi:hypothetical protein